MKRFSVSVFIPAYNAELNIVRLLRSLLSQNYGKYLFIKKIIVLSDYSKDRTVEFVKSMKNPLVEIRSNSKRRGFGFGIKSAFNLCNSDFVVLLNDDVVILNRNLIRELCEPMVNNSKVGLVGGSIEPLACENFIQRVGWLGNLINQRVISAMPSKHNKLTFDGKIMVVARSFYKKIKYPKALSEMGNVDSFIYFNCIKLHFLYRFVQRAKVFYKLPSEMIDLIKLSQRNKNSSDLMKMKFGNIAKREYRATKKFYECLNILEIIKYFPELVALFALHFWVRLLNQLNGHKFNPTWSLVTTTKMLKNI